MKSFVLFAVVASLASGTLSAVAPAWGQCGGQGFAGPTTCVEGFTCIKQNTWYCQCQPTVVEPPITSAI
ncbi:hypothetical protein BKA70DRAFT_1423638 [Coprinopsis sp. MPI-PUGE-AT-0042]|nr:hypothetical protein BKA70DRAFT_1423638 [Coprinopsis sp. MPI-PUGE-AT-0042]